MSGLWIQCAPRSNGTPKICGVGDAAAADPVGRLEQREAPLGGGDAARGGNAGGAGADDHHIDVARRPAPAPSAGAASSAAEAARNERRLSLDMVSECFLGAARQIARTPRGTANFMANSWLPVRAGDEPNCNESSSKFAATRRNECDGAVKDCAPEGPGVMSWMARRGRADSRPLSGKAGAGLRAVHAERSRRLARHAQARRRAAGRRQQPHFRRHQISHAVDLVACRALCRADRRPRDRRRRAAGAGGGQYRPGRGGGAAVEICPLPHPHLPADRTDRRTIARASAPMRPSASASTTT